MNGNIFNGQMNVLAVKPLLNRNAKVVLQGQICPDSMFVFTLTTCEEQEHLSALSLAADSIFLLTKKILKKLPA